MTGQELKDEVKQSEGDPQIKSRIRQIRFERAKKRMIAAVPDAHVVIVNPTHYAVALKYESGKMRAPVCVAKGVDHLALTIRKVAEEHEVPIVENPPLARALFAAVEVDDEIPPDHYKAVAQIIGYVMRLASKNSFWRNWFGGPRMSALAQILGDTFSPREPGGPSRPAALLLFCLALLC